MSDICEIVPQKEQALAVYRKLDRSAITRAFKNAYDKIKGKGKWVYYAGEDGAFLQYPAMKLERGCHEIDHRLRY